MSLTRFDVTSDSSDILKLALKLAFFERTALYYFEDDVEGLPRIRFTSLKSPGGAWVKLFSPIDAERASSMIQDWLELQDYGNEPDHDGSNNKGFRVWFDAWGYTDVAGAFVSISPAWIVYGK